jgi:hypothetical protein
MTVSIAMNEKSRPVVGATARLQENLLPHPAATGVIIIHRLASRRTMTWLSKQTPPWAASPLI